VAKYEIVRASSAVGEKSNQKASYWGDIKGVLGFYKGL